MSIERGQAALMNMGVMENAKVVNITATADTLEVWEQVVNCDTTDNAITITLPPVSEAMGKFYSIKLITDGGNNVTVQDQDDSYDWAATGDLTLSSVTDFGIFFSDGHKWYELQSQTS